MAQVPASKKPYGQECRELWIVDKGNVLVGCDLSGIELRCFAHYLQDKEYINEVVNGDVHTRNQHAFGVATRDIAKTVLYASLYGASAAKVGSIIGIGSAGGQKALDNFSSSVPAYKTLTEKISRVAKEGKLPGLGGYQLTVRSSHAALNTLLQSAGAIIAKQWLVEFTQDLKKERIPYKLVGWIHDEVQIETPEQYGETVGKIVVEAARKAGEKLEFRCPVGAEYHIGKNWNETH
jgi:DNA polymerase I-like protein with 3'-5' exonuclease and polymerase domains